MKSSLSLIAAIGVCGILLVTFLYYGAAGYTPAGKLARVSAVVKERFAFEDVELELVGTSLRILYNTSVHLQYDIERQNSEMKEVADLVVEKCPKETRERARTLAVRRIEVSGAGCFKDRHESTLDIALPPTAPEVIRRGGGK